MRAIGSTRARSGAFVAALAVACSLAGNASAQKKNEAQEAARAEGETALKLFDGGKYAEAIEHFDKADKLFHAPTLVLFEARCQIKLGKLLAARALLERVTGESLPKNAPKQFLEAQKSANAELTSVKSKIAFVRFKVSGGTPTNVVLDGEAVQGAPSDSHEADPGKHKVVVEGPQGTRAEREFTLTEGGNDEVALELPPPTVAAPPPAATEKSSSKGPDSMVFVAYGAGGVGILIGSITGIMSLSKASDAKAGCVASHCPVGNKSSADSASALGVVSTIGFVVGLAGVATGTTLLVLGSKKDTRVGVGPGSITVDGRF